MAKPLAWAAMANLVTVLSRDSRACAVAVTSGASWARVSAARDRGDRLDQDVGEGPDVAGAHPDRGRLSTDLGMMTANGVG